MRLIKIVTISIAVLVGIYFLAALVLTFWPGPSFAAIPEGPTLNQDGTVATRNETAPFEESYFTMRDGQRLFAQHFPADTDTTTDAATGTTIVLVHGVTNDSMGMNRGAAMLQQATGAAIYAIDLRGHGQSDGAPGDVRYIGQYEDDLADIVAALRAQKPNTHIILGGHSMGGGIALRYAMAEDAPPVAGYLLFAPHLGANAPTVPTATTQETTINSEPFIKLNIPRIIGLTILNGMGITQLNGLTTMIFNLPSWRTNNYSFRAMVNSSPADYQAALAAVDAPMLVLVGSADEAFVAEQFPAAVQAYSQGEVQIIEGETHDGIYQNEAVMTAVQTWITNNGQSRSSIHAATPD